MCSSIKVFHLRRFITIATYMGSDSFMNFCVFFVWNIFLPKLAACVEGKISIKILWTKNFFLEALMLQIFIKLERKGKDFSQFNLWFERKQYWDFQLKDFAFLLAPEVSAFEARPIICWKIQFNLKWHGNCVILEAVFLLIQLKLKLKGYFIIFINKHL